MDKLKAAWSWVTSEGRWKWLLAVALFVLIAAFILNSQCNAKLERDALKAQGRAEAEALEAARHKAAAELATREYERAQQEEAKLRADAEAKQKAAKDAADAAALEIERIGESETVDDL